MSREQIPLPPPPALRTLALSFRWGEQLLCLRRLPGPEQVVARRFSKRSERQRLHRHVAMMQRHPCTSLHRFASIVEPYCKASAPPDARGYAFDHQRRGGVREHNRVRLSCVMQPASARTSRRCSREQHSWSIVSIELWTTVDRTDAATPCRPRRGQVCPNDTSP